MSRRRARRLPASLATVALLTATACTTGVVGGSPGETEDVPLVGLLRLVPDEDQSAFVTELAAQGWSDGLTVDVRPEEATDVAADEEAAREQLAGWIDDGVDLIVASSTPYAALAAEMAPTVPTLFLLNDPVAAGLVADPARPEGQLTGVTFRTPADRTLALAAEVIPDLDRVGYLVPADDPAVAGHEAGVRAATDALGLALVEATFASSDAIGPAVDELAAAEVDVVYLANANATFRALDVLERELMRAELPVIGNIDLIDFAVLILAPDSAELRRQLARQAARILAGAEVASVPVEAPRRFVTIVDRGIIDALGLPPIGPDVLRKMDVVR